MKTFNEPSSGCYFLRMPRFRLSLIPCLFLSLSVLSATTSRADTVNLVENGKVQAQLFLPKSVDPEGPLHLAQKELREYFQKMTGQELPVSDRTGEALQKGDLGIRLVVRDEKDWKGKESAKPISSKKRPRPKLIAR